MASLAFSLSHSLTQQRALILLDLVNWCDSLTTTLLVIFAALHAAEEAHVEQSLFNQAVHVAVLRVLAAVWAVISHFTPFIDAVFAVRSVAPRTLFGLKNHFVAYLANEMVFNAFGN